MVVEIKSIRNKDHKVLNKLKFRKFYFAIIIFPSWLLTKKIKLN